MKPHTIMAIAIATASLTAQAQKIGPSIIPEPVETAVAGDDTLRIFRDMPVIASSPDIAFEAEYFAEYMDKTLGLPVKVTDKTATGVPCIRLTNLANGGIPGGYTLTVSANGTEIEGNDAAGVFYGVQTLIQLMPVRAGVVPLLPTMTISDFPRFQYRGMHLDVVRHYFPVEFIKKYIDAMARHKLNYFHWHLTDDQGWRIEMKSHPELTGHGAERRGEIEGLYPGKYVEMPYGGYYTQAQIREITDYSAQRHITVIPEIDIPGHCMAVLAVHPEFSTAPAEAKECALTWGIFNKFNNVLAPKPEVFAFLEDIFSELCDIFPGQYIHTGGDECAERWWKESDKTQNFMKQHNLDDEKALQSYFVHFVQNIVNAKGKILVGWDEVLKGNISKECIIMNWHSPEQCAKSVKSGHRTIAASAGWSYLNIRESRTQKEIAPKGPLSLEKVYGFTIVPDSLTEKEKEFVWGVEGCLWTEYIHTPWKAEFSAFPRMSALAENAWSPENRKDWSRFVRKAETQLARYDLWGYRYSDAFLRTEDIERIR